MERVTRIPVTTAFNFLAHRKTEARKAALEAEKYKTKHNLI
jgi:hypothetical protein